MLFGGKVKNILKNKNGQDAIIEIDNLLSPIFYSNPEKLSSKEQQIVLIEELEREINNGGFNQFFYNSAGDYAHETIAALREVKSVKFLKTMESAVSLFPDSKVPRNRNEREKILERIENDANPEWDRLDSEFLEYDEDIYSLLIDFIQKNIKDFR